MTSVVIRLTASTLLALTGLAAVSAAAAAMTDVRVLVPRYSSETLGIFETAAAAFEAENPEIHIQIETVRWDALFQRLTADISEGTEPDIAVLASSWLVDFSADGVVVPLDGYLTPAFSNLFIPAFLPSSPVDGRVWALPVAASARALYYNTDLFAQADLDGPPATWVELEADARAIAGLGDAIYGFGLQGEGIETDVYFSYAMWAYGAEWIEADGTSGLDSAPAIAAAEMIKRLIDDGLTEPAVTEHYRDDLQELFLDGRLGMLITGPWLADQIGRQRSGSDFGVAPIPSNGQQATYGVSDWMVMLSGSQVKSEAWRFMAFVFQPEQRLAFLAREGFLPTTRAIVDSSLVREDPVLSVFAAMLPEARLVPAIANWEEIADITTNALQRLYDGKATAQEALTAAAADIDAILAD